MKKIFYLGYYDTPENKSENRNICLAANNKMTYVVSAVEKLKYSVEIISASQTVNNQKYDGKIVNIGEKSHLVLFKTFPWGNKLNRIRSVIYSKYQFIKYILKNVGKNDTLMVYHSLAYAQIVCILKKIKKFKLVLEVEEIYSDVNNSVKDRKKEFKIFKAADSYIFSTELLNEKINAENKPFSVSYGTYQVEKDRGCKLNDGRKHIVYAGTFDPRKGGVQASLSAVPFLSSQYHMHILGFGSPEETKGVLDEIKRLSETCECKVTYDGLLSGEEYIRFLQSCDIGMSTQSPDGEFNDTSFPSKVLSYLANGLYVVSIEIPVVKRAEISDLISFYKNSSGDEIAQAIQSVSFSDDYDSRARIALLDKKFVEKLGSMIS